MIEANNPREKSEFGALKVRKRKKKLDWENIWMGDKSSLKYRVQIGTKKIGTSSVRTKRLDEDVCSRHIGKPSRYEARRNLRKDYRGAEVRAQVFTC